MTDSENEEAFIERCWSIEREAYSDAADEPPSNRISRFAAAMRTRLVWDAARG